jgi:hypothetical protein
MFACGFAKAIYGSLALTSIHKQGTAHRKRLRPRNRITALY